MRTGSIQNLFLMGLLGFLVACTNGDDNGLTQEQRDEVLETNSVFNSSQLLASFHNPSQVDSFDGQNRPVVKTETTCNSPDDNNDDENSGDEDLPPPGPICEEGFEPSGDQCVYICGDEQTFAQGECFDNAKECPIENGEGMQEWMANTYSRCQVTSCNEGFINENNSCIPQCKEGEEVLHNDKCMPIIADCEVNGAGGSMTWNGNSYGQCEVEDMECPIHNGKGKARWLASKKKHGKCEVTSCEDGYKKRKRKCELDCPKGQVASGDRCIDEERPCPIAGGEGKQKWNRHRGQYRRCQVVSCNDGFRRRGNSCVEDTWDPFNECDPLIVDLGADTNAPQGIVLSSQLDGILFDILGQNAKPVAHDKKRISWTTNPRYQFVVRPDSNGQVHGIDQMFGDNTIGPDGQFSAEGFEALGKYDIDKNGRIDSDDPVFAELALWTDTNGNGVSDLGELSSLASMKIDSIDLKYDPNFFEVDQFGNKTTYKSVVSFSDGKKTLIFDLWFRYFEPNSCPEEDIGGGGQANNGF